MPTSDAALDHPVVTAGACTTCGKPVANLLTAVIQRRQLYHSECWLQAFSSAPSAESQPS